LVVAHGPRTPPPALHAPPHVTHAEGPNRNCLRHLALVLSLSSSHAATLPSPSLEVFHHPTRQKRGRQRRRRQVPATGDPRRRRGQRLPPICLPQPASFSGSVYIDREPASASIPSPAARSPQPSGRYRLELISFFSYCVQGQFEYCYVYLKSHRSAILFLWFSTRSFSD
jgi:hypothetical protein